MFGLRPGTSFHRIQIGDQEAGPEGLYILHSKTDADLIRIGEASNLSARRNMHAGSPANANWKKPPNWTETFRPWVFVWACNIPGAQKAAREKCEDAISSQLAKYLVAVNRSGFALAGASVGDVIDWVNEIIPELEKISSLQIHPYFDKNDYWRNNGFGSR